MTAKELITKCSDVDGQWADPKWLADNWKFCQEGEIEYESSAARKDQEVTRTQPKRKLTYHGLGRQFWKKVREDKTISDYTEEEKVDVAAENELAMKQHLHKGCITYQD
jgi:hypothetical protein